MMMMCKISLDCMVLISETLYTPLYILGMHMKLREYHLVCIEALNETLNGMIVGMD